MSHHIEINSRTQMTFTRDFREFIRGAFWPDVEATIRYDPYRVVPPGDGYHFGDPARPVVAHLQFNEGGPVTDITLVSLIGESSHISAWTERRVPMLHGELTIPEDADWVTIWFSYMSSTGRKIYDSNWGKNYRLRFYREEIKILDSFVRNQAAMPLNEFVCRIAAGHDVDRVIARYRIVNVKPETPVTSVDLHRTDLVDKDGRAIWETRGVFVPNDAVIAYDIIYFVAGRPFKDDNEGAFFLACLPEVLKQAGY